jgi:hypothetical protein
LNLPPHSVFLHFVQIWSDMRNKKRAPPPKTPTPKSARKGAAKRRTYHASKKARDLSIDVELSDEAPDSSVRARRRPSAKKESREKTPKAPRNTSSYLISQYELRHGPRRTQPDPIVCKLASFLEGIDTFGTFTKPLSIHTA